MKIAMIEDWQVKLIKTLQRQNGLDDETYREMLSGFSVESCTKLTRADANRLIDKLKGSDKDGDGGADRASPAELRLLRFYAIPCAIEYANLGEYVVEETGEVLWGDELKVWLRERFEAGSDAKRRRSKPPIPKTILVRLFAEWINPKSNQFLVEGGLRRYVKNPNSCYYERLYRNEITCLINRFRAMYGILEAQGAEIDGNTNQ